MSLRFGKELRGSPESLGAYRVGWFGEGLGVLGEFLYSVGPPHLVRDSIHSS